MGELYIGLDDTDAIDDSGTGRLARKLARELHGSVPGCTLVGVSRHQLLQDPRVPATRRNRCSCVLVRLPGSGPSGEIVRRARALIVSRAVDGSDPGFGVAEAGQISADVHAFAERAKRELLDQKAARQVADSAGIQLEALGGSGDGIIGALAAIGLRHQGNDGWLTLWRRVRELDGALSVAELLAEGIDAVVDEQGGPLAPSEVIETRERVRPALRKGQAVLVVRRGEDRRWGTLKVTE